MFDFTGSEIDYFLFIGKTVLDIAIVYYLMYRLLLLIKGTRAARVLLSIVMIVVLFAFSKEDVLNLGTVNWILDKFIGSFIIIIVIIFQDDIRNALSGVWRKSVLKTAGAKYELAFIEEIVKSVGELSRIKHGALMALELHGDLSNYTREGIAIDSAVTSELLTSIFIPHFKNALHDGAVVIRDGRIVAAGCILPLSTSPNFDKNLGTRHRAAKGLSERTDAFVIVVSEETGSITVAFDNEWVRGLDVNSLRLRLQKAFVSGEEKPSLRARLSRKKDEAGP